MPMVSAPTSQGALRRQNFDCYHQDEPVSDAFRCADPIDFTLVVPTYNERENLPLLVERIDRALDSFRFELIVVDDDSPDQTWLIAQELQKRYRWLRVIRRQGVRGLSSAVVHGFRCSRGETLAVMDADLQHDVDLLPSLLQEAANAEFAVATRRAAGGSDGEWSRLRRLGSAVATRLARFLANVPFSDPMSGFFALRREVFQSIDDADLRPRGYKILIYLYAKAARRLGKRVIRHRELGYCFATREHGQSKLTAKVMLEYLLMLMELRFKLPARFARPRWSHAIF
jgi:dolichol-phosphate mannosyltransferase